MDKQAVFALFFAIFWGGIMSVSGRWRMFQPVFLYPHILRRFVLSFLLLNIGPIFFFVWEYRRIGCIVGDSWVELAGAVFPALTIFVFYRIWMATVEFWPRCFYQDQSMQALEPVRIRRVEPTIESLALDHGFKGWWNLLAAAIFGAVGLGLPYVIRIVFA